MSKVAVYICHCGGNISDVVDVKKVAEALAAYPGVALAREVPFMCSSMGQDRIIQDIREQGVDRVVVAACSPALHELTFRGVLRRAGLNPYLYEHVNIREQDSWVHKHDKAGATAKAVKLVQAGVEKVLRQGPLEAIRVKAERRVAVIGGGVAGMKAALACADQGLEVVLIEKEPRLGGRIVPLGRLYPTRGTGAEMTAVFEDKIRARPLIRVLTGCSARALSGYVGDFRLDLRLKSGEAETVRAGAVIFATGHRYYEPRAGEYGWGDPRVVTLPEFKRLLQAAGSGGLTAGGRKVRSVAFIHCVGSRQVEGVDEPQADGKLNEYCSRVCCTATICAEVLLKEKFPEVSVYDLHRDIRTYGLQHEAHYERASRDGVLFFRFTEADRPVVRAAEDGLGIKVKDVLTWGTELELTADLVVLAVALMPSDIGPLTERLKLPLGADRFLQEVHPKLRPVELAVDGALAAGTCQAPMDVPETVASAATAAAKAGILLSGGEIELEPFVAAVDEHRCTGCGLCPAECSYEGALRMADKDVDGARKTVASVNPALCKGCGACAAVCGPRAIAVAGWTIDQLEAMVDAIAED